MRLKMEQEQHEEEHIEEEVVDDSGEGLDDNVQFVGGNDDNGDDDSDDGDDDDDDDNDNNDDDDLKLPTNSTLPPLIAEFQEWLASPDGSKKDEKTVMQHGSQPYIMLKAIDNSENLKSLFDLKLIGQVFLNGHVKEKKYEAGTIKSYLMSLGHFYSFVLSDKPDSININLLDVSSYREKVKMWSASYKREPSTQKWQKLEEDMLNRLTPSKFGNWRKARRQERPLKYLDNIPIRPKQPQLLNLISLWLGIFCSRKMFIDNAN